METVCCCAIIWSLIDIRSFYHTELSIEMMPQNDVCRDLTESGNRKLLRVLAQREIAQRLAKTKQPFCTWEMTKRIQLQWQNFIRSISNESNENVYKHEDLFTKHKLKSTNLENDIFKMCIMNKLLHLKGLLDFRKKGTCWETKDLSQKVSKRRKSLHRSCRLQREDISLIEHGVVSLVPVKKCGVAWKTKRSLTRAHTIALHLIYIQNQFSKQYHGYIHNVGRLIMLNNDVSNLRGLNSAFRLGHGQFHVVLWHLLTHIRYVKEILSNKVKCAKKSTHTVYS